MGKSLFACGIIVAVFFVASIGSVEAHHRGRVLAESTPAAEIIFPPVTSGAGLILPDSPFYFLDQLFQAIKLSLAIDPQAKARVRAQIAGERLAELRVMLARNNPAGIDIALSQLTKEVGLAAKSLTDASAQGKDVKVLAKELNDTIKAQRGVIRAVEAQASGDLKVRLRAVREAISTAKLEVEDELPQDELEREIREEISGEIEERIADTDEATKRLEMLIERFQAETSQDEREIMRNKEAVSSARKALEELRKSVGAIKVRSASPSSTQPTE